MRTLTLAMLLTGALAAGTAQASGIYKWVDSEGNVHYGDRPGAEAVSGVQQVALVTRRTDPEQVSAGVEARIERQAQREEARNAAAEAEKAAAAERAEAEERAKQCSQFQQQQQQFAQSRRLYRMTEDGEREYLDESQMAAARDRVAARIQEFCNP